MVTTPDKPQGDDENGGTSTAGAAGPNRDLITDSALGGGNNDSGTDRLVQETTRPLSDADKPSPNPN